LTINFKHKEWDSNFFNLKIGEAEIHSFNSEDYRHFLKKARQDNYTLIYIYSKDEISFNRLQKEKILLVDKKVSYIKTQDKFNSEKIRKIKSYKKDQNYFKVLELALLSGSYSRFKIDKNFSANSFEKLYRTWLDNSLNKSIANDVLIMDNKFNKISGFISYKIINDFIKIGLISVDKNFHGYGIGKLLMKQVEYIAHREKLSAIEVDTQQINKQACSFYNAIGYKIKNLQPIFHLWLNH